jgi:hypothetical protein
MRLLIGGALLLSGCGTMFFGSSHYPGGPKACQTDCRAKGLAMSAFVFAGEYSTACVCGPREAESSSSGAATTAASVAVATMMRQQQAASQPH